MFTGGLDELVAEALVRQRPADQALHSIGAPLGQYAHRGDGDFAPGVALGELQVFVSTDQLLIARYHLALAACPFTAAGPLREEIRQRRGKTIAAIIRSTCWWG